MKLIDYVEQLFNKQAERTGEKRSRLLLNTGVDPAQYRAYHKANRLLSDDMLERIASTYPDMTTYEELKARKAIDQYGSQVIKTACGIVKKEAASYQEATCETI